MSGNVNTIDTSQADAEKKKNIVTMTKNVKSQYNEKVGAIDKAIAKVQAMAILIQKIKDAAQLGEVYVMTDNEKREFNNMGAEKLQINYENMLYNIAEQQEKVEKWFQKKLSSIDKFEKSTGFADAQNAAEKCRADYMTYFIANKAETKAKSML